MKIFNKYKFSDKKPTRGGTISVIMGVVALLVFVWGIYISFKAKGHGGAELAVYALISWVLSLAGTIIGLLSFKEDDKFYGVSKVGSLLCGIMFVMMLAICLMGMGL